MHELARDHYKYEISRCTHMINQAIWQKSIIHILLPLLYKINFTFNEKYFERQIDQIAIIFRKYGKLMFNGRKYQYNVIEQVSQHNFMLKLFMQFSKINNSFSCKKYFHAKLLLDENHFECVIYFHESFSYYLQIVLIKIKNKTQDQKV